MQLVNIYVVIYDKEYEAYFSPYLNLKENLDLFLNSIEEEQDYKLNDNYLVKLKGSRNFLNMETLLKEFPFGEYTRLIVF
jgi:hypothetical protein